ncbi:MAG TPA: response regulator [Chitinophagaceae bacterium]|nr:response regulator [Chitinophagaceae bacterium]
MIKKNILLIDDDSRNIFALSAVLRAKGFQVLSATSAPEGIGLLESNKEIDVVLIDIMMPEMDGYEAMGQIRSSASLSKLPVIAVTAQAMVGDREKTLKAGADDYISKPVDVDVLLALLKKHTRE